jgi:CHAT domain-containing protein
LSIGLGQAVQALDGEHVVEMVQQGEQVLRLEVAGQDVSDQITEQVLGVCLCHDVRQLATSVRRAEAGKALPQFQDDVVTRQVRHESSVVTHRQESSRIVISVPGTVDPEVWFRLARTPMLRYVEIARSAVTSHPEAGLAELTAAVQLQRRAVEAAGPDQPERATYLGALASSLSLLRAATHERQTCQDAVRFCRETLALLPVDHRDRQLHLTNLGLALTELAFGPDDVEAAEAALGAFRTAHQEAGDAEQRTQLLPNLAAATGRLSVLIGDPEGFAEAVRLTHRAAMLGPVGRGRAGATRNLWILPFSWINDHDIGRADSLVPVCRELLGTDPARPDPIEIQAPLLAALAAALAIRVGAGHGDIEECRESVELGRRALAYYPDPDEYRLRTMIYASSATLVMGKTTGDGAWVAQSLELSRECVELARQLGRLSRLLLVNVARAEVAAYEITGDFDALRQAVHHSQQAVQADEAATPPEVLSLSAAIWCSYATAVGDQRLLQTAIDTHQSALDAVPPDSLQGRRMRSSLGMALSAMYVIRGQKPTDLPLARQAVTACQSSVEGLLDGDIDGPALYSNLSHVRQILGQATGDQADLRSAIADSRRTLRTCQPGGPQWLYTQYHLGRVLDLLAERTGDVETLREGQQALRTAMNHPEGRADHRLDAAIALATSEQREGHADRAVWHLARAVELMPALVAPELLHEDRVALLRRFSELATQLISTGTQAQLPERTVELLEQLRGLMFHEALGMRPDLAGLRVIDPSLELELRQLNGQLRRIEAASERAAQHDLTLRRRALISRRDALHQRVRAYPELLDFGQTPTFGELREQAAEGPIIVISMTAHTGWALLVTCDAAEPVRQLALPGLRSALAQERILTFVGARRTATDQDVAPRSRQRAQDEVQRTLGWMWDEAARPILEALGRHDTPTQNPWPRVWWSPLGLLNYLPWHAAERRSGRSGAHAVLDRVISSYTPSIRALAHVRSQRADSTDTMLVVAAPQAPGAPALHGVRGEVEAITRFIPATRVLDGPNATKAQVLAELPRHASVHLACHAVVDLRAALNSRLVLVDDDTNPLTLSDLTELDLGGRQLAVLSACSTHLTGPELIDEALHLTGAFQLAGYRHVIGSLWPVNDRTASDVSLGLYAGLTAGGTQAPQTDLSAWALHQAIRDLRAKYPATPTIWAAHIHTGA